MCAQSLTNRHLTEYTGLDYEMAFQDHYSEVLDVTSDMFCHIFDNIKAQLGQPGQFAASEHTGGAAATVWAVMVTPPVVSFAQHINVAKYFAFHSCL
mgnify:CR=1 FL=1